MNEIKINISNNKMAAMISINYVDNKYPSKSEILDAAKNAGVIYGIDKTIIDQIISAKKPVNNVIFAKGKINNKGEDAQLIWHIEIDINDANVTINENGRADYKRGKIFKHVNTGDDIVSILPPSYGKDNLSVTGENILLPGNKIELPIGENVGVSDDGLTIFAQKNGYVELKNGKVNITNVYQIDGDVDYSTGNVKYDGKVVIKGDVRSGFRVEATDSIFIDGDVEAADIHSLNGDIIIGMGILGKNNANILAGGSLDCGFIQDAKIKIKNDITVSHYIINSDIYCGGKIKLLKNEGLIRGGKIYSEKGVEILKAGSKKGIETFIAIGPNEGSNDVLNLKNFLKKEDGLFRQYELLSKKEKFLLLLKDRIKSLSAEKEQELKIVSQKLLDLKSDMDEIDRNKKEILCKENTSKLKNAIIVRNKLFPGVVVSIDREEFYFEKLYENVIIYREFDNIIIDELT